MYAFKMTQRPKIRLSRLRDIGWSTWDPIGLLESNQTWEETPYADEYDSYMLKAAGMLKREVPKKTVVDYLVNIETDHMGLSFSDDTVKRAEEVVRRIEADNQLWNYES